MQTFKKRGANFRHFTRVGGGGGGGRTNHKKSRILRPIGSTQILFKENQILRPVGSTA